MTSVGENALPIEGKKEITESQLTYGTVNFAHSQKKTAYKYFEAGSGAATSTAIPLAGGNVTQVDVFISPGCYNLSKSYIEYDLNIPSQPQVAAANSSIVLPVDTVDFDAVQLLNTRTSVLGADCRFVNKMVNSMCKAEIPVKDWMIENEEYKPLRVSNQATPTVPAGPNIATGFYQVRTDTTGNAASFVNYLEPSSVYAFAPQAYAQVNFQTVHRRVPLSLFKRSLFALDKVIPFPEKTTLRLIWSPIQNLGWAVCGTAAVNLVDGAVALGVGNGLPNGRYHIENFRVVLYQEADADITGELMKDASSETGMKITIPYVWPAKAVQATANTLHTVVQDIGTSYGFNLQRIYVVPYLSGGTMNLSAGGSIGFYDHSQLNVGATAGANLITNIQTFMNQQPLQPSQLNAAWPQRETLNWSKEYLKGSILSISPKYADYQYLHLDAFDGLNPETDKVEGKYDKDELLSGMPIVAQNQYEVRAQAGGTGIDYYIFMCLQRTLRISRGQWTVDSQA